MLHVRQYLFYEFLFNICLVFFLRDTDIIMTLLQYSLFVALLIPFSYEDKLWSALNNVTNVEVRATTGCHILSPTWSLTDV